ncbi:MAG: tyrosine-type recombinase/integrase [Firmicutes bacterium]|jgi:integrase/recombinase XerC|nr:tyrosine-type recombinase/integrase [Bacillota bacterium]
MKTNIDILLEKILEEKLEKTLEKAITKQMDQIVETNINDEITRITIKKAIKCFINDCYTSGKTESTRSSYKKDLDQLEEYLHSNYSLVYLDKISPRHIAEYRRMLMDKFHNFGLSGATINRKMFALQSFHKFCIKNKLIEEEFILTNFKKLPVKPRINYLNIKHLQKLNEILDDLKGLNRFRDKAIMKMLMYYGVRVSSLYYLKWSDIDYHGKTIHIFDVKKKEYYYVPLIDKVENCLLELYEYRNRKSEYLFSSRQSERLSISQIKRRTSDILKKYDNEIDFTASSSIFRHSLITNLTHKGFPMNKIVKLTNHADGKAYRNYINLTVDDSRELLNSLEY